MSIDPTHSRKENAMSRVIEPRSAYASVAEHFARDPVDFFEGSHTKMQSMPMEHVTAMQLAALQFRFRDLRDKIPILTKLAERQDIREISVLDDILPLLFEHTAFKSYPTALIDRKDFGQLNRWLGKLTTHDLSRVDVSRCQGLDDWFKVLDEQTPLMVCHSSGTTGTFSILPWSKSEWDKHGQIFCALAFQTFGEAADCRTWRGIDVIYPYFRSGSMAHMRNNDMVVKWIAQREERFHCAIRERVSSDVMYLAGRIRASKARGQSGHLRVDPELLGRKQQYDNLLAELPKYIDRFFDEVIKKLAGKQVYMMSTWNIVYNLAKSGLDRGLRNVFAPNSIIVSGGGGKGMTPPADWKERTLEFTGAKRIMGGYSMSEVLLDAMKCERDHNHLNPWSIPFVLDPDTSKPLPRNGVQTGRAAFFDLTADTRWGGFITGDEVSLHWDADCLCGRKTPYIEDNIGRYSEKRGGDDKITCAATEDAHREAMEYLSDLDGPS